MISSLLLCSLKCQSTFVRAALLIWTDNGQKKGKLKMPLLLEMLCFQFDSWNTKLLRQLPPFQMRTGKTSVLWVQEANAAVCTASPSVCFYCSIWNSSFYSEIVHFAHEWVTWLPRLTPNTGHIHIRWWDFIFSNWVMMYLQHEHEGHTSRNALQCSAFPACFFACLSASRRISNSLSPARTYFSSSL